MRKRRSLIVSVLVHVAVFGAVFMSGDPELADATVEPRIAFATGNAAVMVRFLSPEQLAALERGEQLEQVAPVAAPRVQPDRPPMPAAKPTRVAQFEYQPTPRDGPATIDSTHARARPLPEPVPRPTTPSHSEAPARVASNPQPEPESATQPRPSLVHAKPVQASSSPQPEARATQGAAGVTRDAVVTDLPRPTYPTISRRRGEEGLVLLHVTVDPDGRPRNIEVISDPGFPRLVDAARDAVQRARFRPAMRHGQPVPGAVRVPIRFRLVNQ